MGQKVKLEEYLHLLNEIDNVFIINFFNERPVLIKRCNISDSGYVDIQFMNEHRTKNDVTEIALTISTYINHTI